ncbi:alpha-galactosidase [Paenibacillus arenilitoris]|uniref:Alpha-galactosidase n=1 Tax=Paenibacillus arenilitoris TaxID=2772299 RepID=A0A927CQ16_9BACL|nr:alpha-galactosidase [Paenibacillus arenilitoris]MBD2870982.1 alpha-galactosidase [Paenibacillus arenilitoris]
MKEALTIGNDVYRIDIKGQKDALWTYRLEPSGESYSVRPPAFELGGKVHEAELACIREAGQPARLTGGGTERRFRGEFLGDEGLVLEMIFRTWDGSPVVRFAYQLYARGEERFLTKNGGTDHVEYARLELEGYERLLEVRLSDFNELAHQYRLTENPVTDRQLDHEAVFAGPLAVASNDRYAMLLAYEHGSPSTDLYIGFQAHRARSLALAMKAIKGNYCHMERVDADRGYRTVWMQLGAVQGDASSLAEAYRTFVLRHMSEHSASRTPYIFYNTWNFQERNRYWNKKRYLDSMNLIHILNEIDAAHRLGIDVFVIDTGWFVKTGDWSVSPERFPDGLSRIKEKLDGYGMKLGLWFDPKAVALTSEAYKAYESCIVSWNGVREEPHAIWETEASVRMCLVSPYGEAFADKLIELAKRLGVVYFKWDAISQYGCNDPRHDHGGEHATPEERGERFSFLLSLKLVEIARKVAAAIPEAIVDFDVTEDYRCVGLSFLEAGKYFLINNGPYFPNFDIPADGSDEFYNYNVFFHPGPARSMLCRSAYAYDRWLPSILFLTHYFPDDPASNQNISIASLILGHNGIWGDLLRVSEEGADRIRNLLTLYKQVRDDITASYPVTRGEAGSNPEIYEKINAASGRGAVVLFANSFGMPFDRPRPVRHTYVTARQADARVWHTDNAKVVFDGSGRAVIEARFERADAAIVFFGVSEK